MELRRRHLILLEMYEVPSWKRKPKRTPSSLFRERSVQGKKSHIGRSSSSYKKAARTRMKNQRAGKVLGTGGKLISKSSSEAKHRRLNASLRREQRPGR